jgi:ankyrin repeat protein
MECEDIFDSSLSYRRLIILRRFRWVFCQLEVLRQRFPANLRHTLEELPKSLDETYKRILNEINANQVHAYRLLQCLVVARRPLRVEELAEVLALDLTAGGIPKFNANWRWEDQEEAVLSACSSLVSVIIDHGSRIVQFSHFSVKEFLTSGRLASCTEDVSQFHISIEPSHVILAQACLGVLVCLDDSTDQDSVKQTPLYSYSARYWDEHAQVGNVEAQIKDAMDCFFDMDNPHFSSWVRSEVPYEFLRDSVTEVRTWRDKPRLAAPFCFAARKGLHRVLERLMTKDPQQVNQLGSCHGTPLHASVLGGHIKVAQLLVAHGANLNSRCRNNLTPLHIASREGHFKIAKWLLNHGADVNSQDKSGLTPLHFAVSHGQLEACRILLEHNAEVNSRNYRKSTPLLLASEFGYANIVQLLLDHNADVDVRDGDGDTPLHCSALRGQLKVSLLLLRLNVEVNSRNNQGLTPLHQASIGWEEGSASVVRLLLDYGADVQARDLSGRTAAEMARGSEQREIVQLLSEPHALE